MERVAMSFESLEMQPQGGGGDANGDDSSAGGRKNFTSLRAYRTVFPTVLKALRLLDSLDGEDGLRCRWIVERARESALASLSCLSVGYNKYHGRDKAEWYDRARTALCEAHASILALSSLNPGLAARHGLDDDAFERGISSFGSLIRLMERKG